jgi:hypothetical protein
VLRGPTAELAAWQTAAREHGDATRLDFAIPDDVDQLPGALAARTAHGGVTAYLCRGTSCEAPVTRLADLAGRLGANRLE